MADETDPAIAVLLDQLLAESTTPLDFREGSPEVVRFLSRVATYLNSLAVGEFGGRLGPVREEGLVDQVVGAAFQSFADVDPHPVPFDKAAMLLRGITAGHPFQDGNKRTGFLLAVFYLERLDFPLPASLPVDAAESLCRRISRGDLRQIETIAEELKALWGVSDG